ncbi:MAG: hypothetical protein Hals2KO_09670 [Halioglobus sp.]
MGRPVSAQLCLHGAIVMFAAFVSGGMIGMVAMGQAAGEVEHWKLAHNEALINSLVLFAVAGCLGKISLSSGRANVVAVCLILMAYCNTLFGFMRGTTGVMGYQFDDSLANNVATAAGMLGVPLAVVAFTLILIGAFRAGSERRI